MEARGNKKRIYERTNNNSSSDNQSNLYDTRQVKHEDSIETTSIQSLNASTGPSSIQGEKSRTPHTTGSIRRHTRTAERAQKPDKMKLGELMYEIQERRRRRRRRMNIIVSGDLDSSWSSQRTSEDRIKNMFNVKASDKKNQSHK